MGKDLKGKQLGKYLSQRKDGRYCAKIPDGRGGRIEHASRDLDALRIWMVETQHSILHGQDVASSANMTVDAWFEKWYAQKSGSGLRPNTLRRYKTDYGYVRNVIGKKPIRKILASDCQHALNAMAEHYAASTIAQSRKIMHMIFQAAIDDRLIDYQPVTQNVTIPKARTKKQKTGKKALTPDEELAFLNAMAVSTYFRQYRLALHTGLRVSELAGLKWQDIDMAGHRIHVQRNLLLDQASKTWEFGPPKSDAGDREIPMTDEAYQILSDLRDHREIPAGTPKEYQDLVFISCHGKPIRTSTYDHDLKRRCERAGIRPCHMHTLRHTFATRAREAGMDAEVLAAIMGHAHVSVTMDTYVHVDDARKCCEMQKFAAHNRENNIWMSQKMSQAS